jgi:hypothetical protein
MLGRTPPCAIVTCPRSLKEKSAMITGTGVLLVQFFVVPDGKLEMTGDDTS